MGCLGRTMRLTIFRSGKQRRVWFGMGRGIKLTIDPHAPLHKYIGTIECELSPSIKRLTERGTLCFDIGGYDAQFAMTLARRSGAKVCSFEIAEERAAAMRDNITLNVLNSQVRVINTNVSDRTAACPREDTVDDMIAQGHVFVPDFVKIDVEGDEMKVLRGATHLLRSRMPHVLVEIHSTELALECLQYLERIGYKPETIARRRWLRENRGTGRNEWLVARGHDRSRSNTHSPNDGLPTPATVSSASNRA